MTSEILDEVKNRKHFYRDHYRNVLYALMICLFIIALLIMAIAFLMITRTHANYYATSSVGKLTRIYAAPWGSRFEQPFQGQIGTHSAGIEQNSVNTNQ